MTEPIEMMVMVVRGIDGRDRIDKQGDLIVYVGSNGDDRPRGELCARWSGDMEPAIGMRAYVRIRPSRGTAYEAFPTETST